MSHLKITKSYVNNATEKKSSTDSLMGRESKTYAQVIQTKTFEYFGREIQVAAK
jgi:hypothetical protein